MKNSLVLFLLLFSVYISVSQDNRGYLVSIGDTVGDLKLTMLDGTVTEIQDLKGKVVVLQFTASWCSVCRREMPFLEKEVWQVNKDKDFILIAVDLKENPEKVKEFITKTGISYPVAIDNDGSIFAAFADEKAGVTRNVVIDKNGKIAFLTRLFDKEEFEEMKNAINSLL